MGSPNSVAVYSNKFLLEYIQHPEKCEYSIGQITNDCEECLELRKNGIAALREQPFNLDLYALLERSCFTADVTPRDLLLTELESFTKIMNKIQRLKTVADIEDHVHDFHAQIVDCSAAFDQVSGDIRKADQNNKYCQFEKLRDLLQNFKKLVISSEFFKEVVDYNMLKNDDSQDSIVFTETDVTFNEDTGNNLHQDHIKAVKEKDLVQQEKDELDLQKDATIQDLQDKLQEQAKTIKNHEKEISDKSDEIKKLAKSIEGTEKDSQEKSKKIKKLKKVS